MYTAWSTDNNLGSCLESLHVVPNASTSDTSMAVDRHEVTDGNNDFLDLLSELASGRKNQSLTGLDVGVELLQDGNGKCSGFSST